MILDLDTYETLGVFSHSERIEQSWFQERVFQVGKERVRGAARRADPAERPVLLKRQRESMRKRLAEIYADPQSKSEYLARRRELSAKYRAAETPEKTEARRAKAREYQRRRSAK
jgi:hypothetical protein